MDAKTLTTAIRDLILEAAPERKAELARLWDRYTPQFDHAYDKPGFHIEGGAFGLVPFTPRTMGQVWILGFASWKAFEAYCPYLVLCNEITPAAMTNAPGQAEADQALEEVLEKFEELRTIENVDRFDWPSYIMEPTTSPRTVEESAIIHLVKIATAYMFLHEVRHVMFQNTGERPANKPDEEIACDRFAREFLLDRIPDYCRMSSYPEDGVSNKRLAGLALGAFIVLRITRDWAGSATYPPLASRLRELIRENWASPKGDAWDYVCCLLLGMLRRERKLPANLTFTSPQDLFEKLLKVIESQEDPHMPAR